MVKIKDILEITDTFYKTALQAGYNVPGYTRMQSADSDLQNISRYVLSKYYKHPFGTVIPFHFKGSDYGALIEEHGPSNTIKQPHPGVSLFLKSTSLPKNSELSQRSLNIISGLDPVFQPYVIELLKKSREEGLRPELVDGRRTQERQDQLYEQGRTVPGRKVTWTRISKHVKGLAVDIAELDDKGQITFNTSPGFYDKLAKIAGSLNITWGGNFPNKDIDHFQYSK